jgi:hypothetical protein
MISMAAHLVIFSCLDFTVKKSPVLQSGLCKILTAFISWVVIVIKESLNASKRSGGKSTSPLAHTLVHLDIGSN